MFFVDFCNLSHGVLISDREGWHFGGRFIGGSEIISTVFFLPAFVLLQMDVELFPADWLIADDAIDCLEGLFEIVGEGAESIGVGIIGRFGLMVA